MLKYFKLSLLQANPGWLPQTLLTWQVLHLPLDYLVASTELVLVC